MKEPYGPIDYLEDPWEDRDLMDPIPIDPSMSKKDLLHRLEIAEEDLAICEKAIYNLERRGAPSKEDSRALRLAEDKIQHLEEVIQIDKKREDAVKKENDELQREILLLQRENRLLRGIDEPLVIQRNQLEGR